MTYHLNKQWKFLIVGFGVVVCFIGFAISIAMLISGQATQNIGALLGLELLFGGLGIELIYEGMKTKIEIFEDRIVYYQSRYVFSAQWSDLQRIIPSPGMLVLLFSKSEEISGGWIYKAIKRLNMHNSLAINYYLTNKNRSLIREKVIKGLKIEDQNEIKALIKLI